MLSLQRTLSLGYLAQHPTRVVLVVVSIALGVGTLVATRSLDDILHKAAEKAVNPFATFADILVVNGATGVPADLADRLNDAHLPGLAERGRWSWAAPPSSNSTARPCADSASNSFPTSRRTRPRCWPATIRGASNIRRAMNWPAWPGPWPRARSRWSWAPSWPSA